MKNFVVYAVTSFVQIVKLIYSISMVFLKVDIVFIVIIGINIIKIFLYLIIY